MPLSKLQFRPGINKESTNYSNEGGFWAGDKIRFRSGFPEKLGGWVNESFAYTFKGVARTLWNWVSLTSENLLGIGTSQKYYVQNSAGGLYNDITPLRTTTAVLLPADPITTVSGSKLVTVTAPGHGAAVNSYVAISGATAVGGLTISGEYEIVNLIDGNSYNIVASSAASSPATGGGAAVYASYQINAGSSSSTTTSGYGGGVYGGTATSTFVGSISGTTLTVTSVISGTIAAGQNIGDSVVATGTTIVSGAGLSWVVSISQSVSSRTMTGGNTGYGIGGTVTVYSSLRLWSQDNYGQDLLLAPRSGPIYYWTKDTTSYARAITLAAKSNTVQQTSTTATSGGAGTTITVADSSFIDVGSVVISGVNIANPGVDYVTSIFGNVVTLSASTTGAASGTYLFSYAGRFVPYQTNYVIASDTSHFTIALGANPYDPTNNNTAFDPMLVRWSDQDNPYDWVPKASNQSGEQHLSNGSGLVCAQNTRQEILIWSDAALFSMQYLGPPYVWGFNLLMDNISIISPNSAITVNSVTYWMGVDKFYMYSGRVETLPCTLRNFVFLNINRNQFDQVVCGTNEGYNEVWWFYPSANSQTNDSYIIYNHLERIWYYGTLSRTAWLDSPLRQNPMASFSVQNTYLSSAITSSATTIPVLNPGGYPSSGTIVIGTEQIIYSSITGSQFDVLVDNGVAIGRGANGTTAAAHSAYDYVTMIAPNQVMDHEIGVDDNAVNPAAPIAAYVESSDFDIGDGHNFGYVWRMLPDLSFDGSTTTSPAPVVYLTVKARTNSGSAYTTGDIPAVTSVIPVSADQYTGEVFTRIRGRQMAFKISSADLGVDWQLGATRIDTRPDGRR